MKLVECIRCGSKELHEHEGGIVCAYCQSRFILEVHEQPRKAAVIDLQADIQMLLKKCADDPANRRRYASMILEIDPSNLEAMKFL